MNKMEYLLGNKINTQVFLKEYWGKCFIHIKGHTNKFNSIFSYGEFNHVLNYSSRLFTYPIFRMFKNGNLIPEIKYTDTEKNTRQGFVKKISKEKVNNLCKDGSTIVVNGISKLHSKLKMVEVDIEKVFNYPVQINSYYTGVAAQGFNTHYDTHDVIILQVEGTKEWRVYDDITYKFPLSDQPYFDKKTPNEVYTTIVMNKGDFLYIPRGVWHSAKTIDDSSLHLTIDIFVKTGIDFLYWVVNSLKTEEVYRHDIFENPDKIQEILRKFSEKLRQLNDKNEIVMSSYKDYISSEINTKNNEFSFPNI